MDMMSGFEVYFNIITLACGLYALYTAIKLRKLNKLFSNQLLVPKDAKPGDCLDEEGYVDYVKPRLLILGIVLVIVGAICLADSALHVSAALFPGAEKASFYLVEGGIVLSLIALAWYMVCWTKARKLFWV